MKRLMLASAIVLLASAEVRGGESWQDPPNPYDRNGYDNDGGYSGEPYTWGQSWDKRTPLKPAAPKQEKKPAPKSEPQKKETKK